MAETYRHKYGLDFKEELWLKSKNPQMVDLAIEFYFFINHCDSNLDDPNALVSDHNRYHHYRAIHAALWPKHELKYNEWMEILQYSLCTEPHLTVTGAGGTGKSTEAAKYALTWWRAPYMACFAAQTDPNKVEGSLVAATSTTLGASKKRIFGIMLEMMTDSSVGESFWGYPANTNGIIRHRQGNDKFSIAVVAGGQDNQKEGYETLRGWHQPRAMLILDELQDMTQGIVKGALNLSKSTKEFQTIALGNACSWFDELGKMMEPLEGFKSISVESDRWRTKRGLVIHLDGHKSPNITEPEKNQYAHLPTEEENKKDADEYGESSIYYWQQVRAFPNPQGAIDCVIPELMFANSLCQQKAVWKEGYTMIAGLDPAYSGGDKCMFQPAKIGESILGKQLIEFQKPLNLTKQIDHTLDTEPQIAKLVVQLCKDMGIKPEHLAMDSTAQGRAVYHEINRIWGHLPIAVEFGGSASDLIVGGSSLKPSHEHYTSRTAELWGSVRIFLQEDQLRGLNEENDGLDTVKEFSNRKFTLIGSRMKIESKPDFKIRNKTSPDRADAASLVIEVARRMNTLKKLVNNQWENFAKSRNKVHAAKSAYGASTVPIA